MISSVIQAIRRGIIMTKKKRSNDLHYSIYGMPVTFRIPIEVLEKIDIAAEMSNIPRPIYIRKVLLDHVAQDLDKIVLKNVSPEMVHERDRERVR
jgi:hypothetical protein